MHLPHPAFRPIRSLLHALTLVGMLLSSRTVCAQYYYRQQVLNQADRGLDKAECQLFFASNMLDAEQSRQRLHVAATEGKRQTALQQNAINSANASNVTWRAQLVEQAARINASYKLQLNEARASLAAESRRVEKGARDAETGLAALLDWRDSIAKHHAENQAYFQRMGNLATFGTQIVSTWVKFNGEREMHLTEDLTQLRDKEHEILQRTELYNDRNVNLEASERLLTDLESALLQRRADLKTRNDALQVRKTKLLARQQAMGVATTPPSTAPAAHEQQLLDDCFAYRKAINDKAKTDVWKAVTTDLPAGADGNQRYLKGWFDGTSLQRLMEVDSASDKNESITFYYWRDGKLHSVFQRRKGAATRIDGVIECTDTYNFINDKLVAWKHTHDNFDSMIGFDKEAYGKMEKSMIESAVSNAKLVQKARGQP